VFDTRADCGATRIAQPMSDMLQLAVRFRQIQLASQGPRHSASRLARGTYDQVRFSTMRGSGWPGLNSEPSAVATVERWPSATAHGTE